jgi:DNA primase
MAREEAKLAVRRAIEGKKPSSTGWIRVLCPFCGHDKPTLSVNVSNSRYGGYYVCWRASCGAKGFFTDRSVTFSSDRPVTKVGLPLGFQPLTTKSGAIYNPLLDKYRKYLYGRGVSQEIIDDVGIGYCDRGREANMVVVPIMTEGSPAGYIARSIVGKKYSLAPNFDREHHMFNMDALKEETELPVIIVEGVFDALPHWPFAVAALGQLSHRHWELLLSTKRPVVWALDADVQSKNEMYAARMRLHGLKSAWMEIPPGMDPGGANRERFLRKAFSLFKESFK